ncbi:MAG: aspartate aminotransferase family protein [Alphaproteobacteria bacterium]|nr:aspartate aminotransferase family protein [Alphaproteobacteria bacterium]
MKDIYDDVLAHAQKHGRAYLAQVHEQPVFPSEEALSNLKTFEEALPTKGQSAIDTIDMLHAIGSPATVATTGHRYFGFVVGGTVPASVGANWLAGAWDQSPSSFMNSPVGTKLESVAAGWLRDILGLPDHLGVGMTTGATMANFTGLAAGRSALLRRAGWNVEEDGLYGAPEIKVIVSEEVHVTVEKALAMLGLGKKRVTRVPTDANGAMKLDALPELDALTMVCTQAGNVNTGAIDPIGAICARAREVGAWVHVDGAFGLWGRLLEHMTDAFEGIEQADSLATDAHKWLNTPYDCGIVLTRHPEALHHAMATVAPYFKAEEAMAPKDMVPEFSRRARGVEVWAALRSLGRDGVTGMIEGCCVHARHFADGLQAIGFDVLNDVVLNQVVATIGSPEELADIRALVEASGECWFGPTVWKGRHAVRISVSSWRTTAEDVERSLAAIAAAKAAILGD